jgi:hypothetical protein
MALRQATPEGQLNGWMWETFVQHVHGEWQQVLAAAASLAEATACLLECSDGRDKLAYRAAGRQAGGLRGCSCISRLQVSTSWHGACCPGRCAGCRVESV